MRSRNVANRSKSPFVSAQLPAAASQDAQAGSPHGCSRVVRRLARVQDMSPLAHTPCPALLEASEYPYQRLCSGACAERKVSVGVLEHRV